MITQALLNRDRTTKLIETEDGFKRENGRQPSVLQTKNNPNHSYCLGTIGYSMYNYLISDSGLMMVYNLDKNFDCLCNDFWIKPHSFCCLFLPKGSFTNKSNLYLELQPSRTFIGKQLFNKYKTALQNAEKTYKKEKRKFNKKLPTLYLL